MRSVTSLSSVNLVFRRVIPLDTSNLDLVHGFFYSNVTFVGFMIFLTIVEARSNEVIPGLSKAEC
jgi:hypothetical protein